MAGQAWSRSELAAVLAGDVEAMDQMALGFGPTRVRGVPPAGALIGRIREALPGGPYLTMAVRVATTSPTPLQVAFVDGQFAGDGSSPRGLVELPDGISQFIDLVTGDRRVRNDLQAGRLRGDMVGLSQFTWFLEHPATREVVAPLGPGLRSVARSLEALWREAYEV